MRFRLSPRLAVLPLLAAALLLPAVRSTHVAAATESARDMAPATPESVGISADRVSRIDARMKQMVDENRLAGVVTLLTRHGKIVDVTVHGKKDIRSADPIQRDSIFRIYSMTKPITGVAMMMLYEEGKWRLDDPVSRYIPEFAKLKVYAGENPDGTPKLEDARRSMTMRELMTHTAGFGYTISAEQSGRSTSIARRSSSTPRKPLQNHDRRPREDCRCSASRERAGRTASRVDVQGYLVEKFSGQIVRRLRAHANLRAARHEGHRRSTCRRKKLSRLALVHSEDPATGKTHAARERPRPDGRAASAPRAAAVCSRPLTDYARFCEMLLEGGQFSGARLLAPRTVEMMRTNHVMPDPLKTMPPGTGWGHGLSTS